MPTQTAAQSARADKALATIDSEKREIVKLEKAIDSKQKSIAKAALAARKNGVTLQDIADRAGYSIGWVQQKLVSVGYEPRSYVKNGSES